MYWQIAFGTLFLPTHLSYYNPEQLNFLLRIVVFLVKCSHSKSHESLFRNTRIYQIT